MKTKSFFAGIASLAMIIGASSFNSYAQYNNGGNPGIVIAGSADISQLPEKAKNFLDKHFKGTSVRTCEKFFAKGKYEVELASGIDLEFNTDGEIIELDAPGNTVFEKSVVKDVLPHKAYDRLEKDGYAGMVESIEFKKGKAYEVEIRIPDPTPDTYIFNPEGIFIAIED